MKNFKKAMIGLTAAALAGTMLCTAAFAAEAQAPQQTIEEAAEEAKVFTTQDGVLSIELPKDDDRWTQIEDASSWFAIGDGSDVITVDHIANGEKLPAVEIADEKYEEIYQMFYSTQNEVFTITGRVADKAEAECVRNAVNSFKVLKYDTLQKKEEQPQAVYAVRDLNETRYCTEKAGVNVRNGYTTDDRIIGLCQYGTQIQVTGAVTKDGADTGWIRVNYNGMTGFTWGEFYSTTQPAPIQTPAPTPAPAPAPAPAPEETGTEDELIAGGQIFTGATQVFYNEQTGEAVTLSQLNQGGWANPATGVVYTQESGGGDHMYGDDGSVLVTEWYYSEYVNPGQLIAGGKIFTGAEMELWDPEGGGNIINVKELSQGGWVDEETGVIYTQDDGNENVYHGNDGTKWVTEEMMNALHAE